MRIKSQTQAVVTCHNSDRFVSVTCLANKCVTVLQDLLAKVKANSVEARSTSKGKSKLRRGKPKLIYLGEDRCNDRPLRLTLFP
jgi:hypothetical protein